MNATQNKLATKSDTAALASAGVSESTFGRIAKFLKDNSGFCLTPQKSYLINTRLARVAAEFSLSGVDALAVSLSDLSQQQLKTAVIEAMTTNETLFFRDGRPFRLLTDTVLPLSIEAAKGKPIRILSAAASTGQEAYSIALSIRQHFPSLDGRNIQIVGTDIDSNVLEKAASGIYSRFEVQRGLPTALLIKHFVEQTEGTWKVKDDIRRVVEFQKSNLLGDLSGLGQYDIIFCRNVLIYFDVETKKRALSNLARIARQNCFLFLGASETAVGISDRWAAVNGERALFRKQE